MSQNFLHYSQYYDLLYGSKDYKDEVRYINAHIKELLPGASTILELGSGTGNHAQHFSSAGYAVTGIERSKDMAAISITKQIPGFVPVIADMSSFELNKSFDVAISLFHSLCYLTTNEELINCFSAVYRHLKPSGLFCFDFWYGPAVLHDLPTTRERRLETGNLELKRVATTEMFTAQNVAVVNYEMTIAHLAEGTTETISEQHPMRYLSIPELDLLCRQTGFRVVTAETFLTGGAPNLNSWNVFSILQRIN